MSDLTTEETSRGNNEIWKPVIGFEGFYEVSNLGRVKRVKAGRGAIAGKILSSSRLNHKGYPEVFLHKQENGINTRKSITIHIVVASVFLPPKPTHNHQINHKNTIKTDNSSDNLEWVTGNENIAHSWKNGLRSYFGENNHTTKLTEFQVWEIIKAKHHITQRELAKHYRVHVNQIKGIHRGIAWKHITWTAEAMAILGFRVQKPSGSMLLLQPSHTHEP